MRSIFRYFRRRPEGAIIFLIDYSFLPGLRVFAYSARHAFREATEDIVVLTDDPRVYRDAFVQAFADRVIFIGKSDSASMLSVRTDALDPSLRREGIGSYWFLKFYTFRDFGYAYHIMLDTDLLCLSRRFRFAEFRGDYGFSAAPTIWKKALGVDEYSEGVSPPILETVQRISRTNYDVRRTFNAGVARIGKELIGDATFRALVERASQHSFSHGQEVMRQHIKASNATFRSLPIWLNFPILPAAMLGEEKFAGIRDEIRILHYNREPKPWSPDATGDWLDKLWLDYRESADAWAWRLAYPVRARLYAFTRKWRRRTRESFSLQ